VRRALAAAVVAAVTIFALANVATGQGTENDVIVPGTTSDADYHAEGRIKEGGNIQIQTDRAPQQGQALQRCDPDPRPAPHNRPDCAWATPNGSGREQTQINGQIGRPDTDTSPNKSFTPDSSDTREILNGIAALDDGNGDQRFDGDFFNDEDMHFRLTPRTLDAYLAPEGDANNRWRRICGTGTVEQFNNSGKGNNDPRAPFLEGQVRKFVLQTWDADFREPSNADGGNQDYFIIDILAPGSGFDTTKCQTVNQQNQPAPPAPPNAPPAEQTVAPGVAPSTSPARGTAALSGPGGCRSRAFTASVTGRNIAQVVFLLDGRKVKTLTKPNAGSRWTARITPRKLKLGTHRVRAGVSFVRNATPRVRVLSLTFQRCARAARRVSPRFTG
jgi:hypothetical protein